MKFSDLGTDNLKDSTTFKKIQYFSKSNPQKLYSNVDEFNLKYKKLSDLYLSDYEPMTSSSYGLKRQHNYVLQKSSLSNSITRSDFSLTNTLILENRNNFLVPSSKVLNKVLNPDYASFNNKNLRYMIYRPEKVMLRSNPLIMKINSH